MKLTRYLMCAALVGTVAFAAERSTLPAPMSSAIERLVRPGKHNALPETNPFTKDPNTRILDLSRAQARLGLQTCSIPLAQVKVPDKPKFFIQQMPVPKHASDAMPVLKAPVCPVPEAR